MCIYIYIHINIASQFGQLVSYKSLDFVATTSKLCVYHMYNISGMQTHCTKKHSIKELHRCLQAHVDQ